ncbi:amidohydrolase family protein [Siccirubricoccus sp. KC 17139]|uniref:Amidohydrolase family protein n=1 Tax=Siccirubricoccus soli TaxID=2899147 RepID=A0ABT1DAR2_9PROT|nr:amidohydrolase family protein [Siccirubricoccus soli]MCO6419032.1 amidohydrolase family protein [Siccirubricoccus soli]MCP2685167.1 amidohydrolase family protein [Siccirubricoccus soli]
MHSTVIRGGTIIDGTGKPGFTGDIALDGDRIAQVGGKAGPGKREIDASGLIVTPGWVDAHTHYDGQATWDSMLAPSSWHGVTTILFGNCGVGFAPVRRKDHAELIGLMESIEEIPGIALAEGLKWNWESFPDYLDALDGMQRTIDIGAQIPHHPLRVYVMGERAIKLERATADDIAEMHRLTLEGMKAGAFGFTTSRTNSHKTPTGGMVPSRYSEIEELMGIGRALGKVGYGAFGMNSDFDIEESELAWMTQLGKETGRPVWFLLTDRPTDDQRWKRLMDGVRAARAAGAHVTAQVPGRPVGVMLGADTALNPFSIRPSYQRLLKLPIAERMQRLRDPAVRAEVLADTPSEELLNRLSQFRQHIVRRWHRMFKLGNPPNYEPAESESIAAIAQREGRTPDEVAYDYIAEDPANLIFFPVTGYNVADLEVTRSMLTDDVTLLGLSDGGAHCSSILDAGMPTWMLIHWARDRTRGPRLPLEFVVKRQTSETAKFFGLNDRGTLEVGKKADLNVIDFHGLRVQKPEVVYDLPAGGRRLVQQVSGYKATFVSGVPVFENGEHTGALPGKLVRAGR